MDLYVLQANNYFLLSMTTLSSKISGYTVF